MKSSDLCCVRTECEMCSTFLYITIIIINRFVTKEGSNDFLLHRMWHLRHLLQILSVLWINGV